MKRPAVGGLLWDVYIAMATALGIAERGNGDFVTGRSNAVDAIIRELNERHPNLGISELRGYVGELHSLEHAGEMRRWSYGEACGQAAALLMSLNSLLPAGMGIEREMFDWLTQMGRG